MPTKFVIEVDEDILNDVKEYAKAQDMQPYEWIKQLVRISVGASPRPSGHKEASQVK
jgi:hypothetical protein